MDNHSFAYVVSFVVKFFEPIFWCVQVFIGINLLKPRFFFESNVKFLNKLIRIQGFEAQLETSDKAFKVWRRDLLILFFLNIVLLIFIHLI